MSLLQPVISYLMEVLPGDDQRQTRAAELHLSDLDKLSQDDTARISEWLVEKIDALSTKLKPEPQNGEEVSALPASRHCCRCIEGLCAGARVRI